MFDWFDSSPNQFCCLNLPRVVWPMMFADAAIALAYFVIAVFLIWTYFKSVRGGRATVMHAGWMLFGLFIFFCGLGHAIDVVKIFHPVCDTMAVVRLATAAVSMLTCIWLWRNRREIRRLYFSGVTP